MTVESCLRGLVGALSKAALPVLLATSGAAGVVMPGTAWAQAVALPGPAPVGIENVEIENVVNVIGFDQLRRGSDGKLAFKDGHLVLAADKATGTIPLGAIRSFTIDKSTTALMRGTEGKIIGFIPRGVGNLYHAIRRGAHVLTIYYADKDDALHGTVLILPKDRKNAVLEGFAGAGLSPAAVLAPWVPTPSVVSLRPTVAAAALPGAKPSVTIMLPDANGLALPTAYAAATYEELNAELAKSGLFDTIWRHGDARAPVDALTLSVRVTGFKKGNPGLRGAIPIPVIGMLVGKTLLTADLTLTAPSGTVLLHRQVKGSKRMSGESIGAAKSLAQRVSGSIKKAPGFAREKAGTDIAAR